MAGTENIGPASSPPRNEAASGSLPLWPPASRQCAGVLEVEIHSAIRVPFPSAVWKADSSGSSRGSSAWKIYAVLECGLDQTSSEAVSWVGDSVDLREQPVDDSQPFRIHWNSPEGRRQFWVYGGSSKLTAHILAQNHETMTTVILCSFPTEADWELRSPSGVQCYTGGSKLLFNFSFRPEGIPTEPKILPEYECDELAEKLAMGKPIYHREGLDSEKYTVVTIRSTVESPVRFDLLNAIQHGKAFINPVAFVYQSEKNLFRLVSRIPGGGNLFVHLQRERYFTEARVKKYGAELVCAIEWLHQSGVVASLHPENVMLDTFDHIRLCAPAVFIVGNDAATAERPAPELLHGLTRARTADWWDLGIFLYEMLTSLPPSLPKVLQDGRGNMADFELPFPANLSVVAKDLLSRLIQPNLEQRLGANGVLEIQSHPFFKDVVWHDLKNLDMQVFRSGGSGYLPRLRPRSAERRQVAPVRRMSQGRLYEKLEYPFKPGAWGYLGLIMGEADRLAYSKPTPPSAGWQVVWEETASDFRFSNSLSGEARLSKEQAIACGLTDLEHLFSVWAADKSSRARAGSALATSPIHSQVKSALAVALKLHCNDEIVRQILDYGVDLDANILEWDEIYDTYVRLEGSPPIPVTPLEWAIEHLRTDLVDLFLSRGADINYTGFPRHGPALVTAVLRRSCELVRTLVGKTERVAATRALCLAVEQEDREIVEALLISSVRCEFKESDWPKPLDYGSGCTFRDEGRLDEYDFTPPLARAVRLGNIELVRMLLAHGADPNVAYHHLCCGHPRQFDFAMCLPRPEYSCGRPVYLAMELDFDKIAEVLIDGGADIYLPQPSPVKVKRTATTFELHKCPVVTRSVHLDVTSRLEAALCKVKSNRVEE